jgi:hypothetical protein
MLMRWVEKKFVKAVESWTQSSNGMDVEGFVKKAKGRYMTIVREKGLR